MLLSINDIWMLNMARQRKEEQQSLLKLPRPSKAVPEKKQKLLKENPDESAPTKRSKGGLVGKIRKPRSPVKLVDEPSAEDPPRAQYLVHQSLAVSRRHVAASYWTAASDVAATSSPVNAGHRRSTTVNAVGHRSTAANHGGDRRSTVAVNDGLRRRPPVNSGGQRRLPVANHR
nr:hypothetical protein [Tanacetum cinerariifolium]